MFSSSLRVMVLLMGVALVGVDASGDGIAGTGIRFHSIVIDGVHYETDHAVVRSNGAPTTLDQLQVGHRVYAVVDSTTMQATEIDQFDAVVGRIDNVVVVDETLNEYELEVMGQVVRTRIETVMHVDDGFKFDSGKWVKINGVRLGDDAILATSLEAPKDKDPILMGIVGSVDDWGFEISGVRVETPYHFEYVQEGWLVPGAAVQISGGKFKHGVLEGEAVIRVPDELVTLEEPGGLESAQSWVEGKVEWIDPEARMMTVNGFEMEITGGALMLDKRDEVRTFDVDLLYAADDVEVVVQRRSGRLAAVKVVRIKKSKKRLRAPVDSWDDLETSATLLGSHVPLEEIKDLKFRGKKLKFEDARGSLDAGDALLLEWNSKGKLKKLTVVSESERWRRFRKD